MRTFTMSAIIIPNNQINYKTRFLEFLLSKNPRYIILIINKYYGHILQ